MNNTKTKQNKQMKREYTNQDIVRAWHNVVEPMNKEERRKFQVDKVVWTKEELQEAAFPAEAVRETLYLMAFITQNAPKEIAKLKSMKS